MQGETHNNFDAGLQSMTDDARRSEAIEARKRRGDRRVAAGLSGTFAGTLTEIAESRSAVTVLTRTGSTLRGHIVSIGPDVIALGSTDRTRVVVRLQAIEGLRETGQGHDRNIAAVTGGLDLADVLDEAGNQRSRVTLTLASGNALAGHIDRVGIDQVVLTLDGDGEAMTVPLAAIDQVVVA